MRVAQAMITICICIEVLVRIYVGKKPPFLKAWRADKESLD